MRDWRVRGGHLAESYSTQSPLLQGRFLVHEHKVGSFPYVNQHYWPHFSFRPSVIDVKSILTLGAFTSERAFFERTFADKYNEAGFRSAFMDEIVCMHIGAPAGTSTLPNAYRLNNVPQHDSARTTKAQLPAFKDCDVEVGATSV